MSNGVENGTFACLAFCTRGLLDPEDSVLVADDIFAHSKSPFTVDEFWRKSLGEIQIAKLEESTIYITATSEFASHEHYLRRRVQSIHFGLLLQGVGYNGFPASSGGTVLTGPISHFNLDVRSIGEMHKHYEPQKVMSHNLSARHLARAAEVAKGIDEIYSEEEGTKYLRIRKGFQAFINGTLSIKRHERVHHFVRSLEALVRPTPGKYMRQFAERVQYFTGHCAANTEIARDMYELRSVAEHVNPMSSALPRFSPKDKDNVINIRTYQAELLASFALVKILTNPALRKVYESDESIERIWRMEIRNLNTFWGNEFINLEQITDKDNRLGYFDWLGKQGKVQ